MNTTCSTLPGPAGSRPRSATDEWDVRKKSWLFALQSPDQMRRVVAAGREEGFTTSLPVHHLRLLLFFLVFLGRGEPAALHLPDHPTLCSWTPDKTHRRDSSA